MAKYFTRSKVFLYILASFILGVFLGNYVGGWIVGLPLTIILLNCYIVALLLILVKNKVFRVATILLLVMLLGVWCYQSFLPKINENHVAFYNDTGERLELEGIVDDEPKEKGNSLSLRISNIQFPISNQYPMTNIQVKGGILLSVPKYYEVSYGDTVRFNAKLETPQPFEEFDYKEYLERFGVYSIAQSVDDFQVVDRNHCRDTKFCVSTGLYKIKNYFSSIIQKIYPEPHASFMLGILIGAKSSLPDWLLLIFQTIGITHIIAISGYNITILAKVAEKTLGKIGRKFIFWGVLGMIVSFVIMTGAQASIVRAGIMGGLLVYAGFIGRKSAVINVLVFAGALMILLNPLILRDDIGFQLSFLATLGLVYISPMFEKWLSKLPITICQLLSATLAAQVLTLPILASSFGLISLISPLANIIILPFIPISMFLGFLSGGLGMIWLPLGRVVGFLGYIVLEIVIKISEVLAMPRYASVELQVNGWIIWGIYYLVVGILVWTWYRRNKSLKT